MSRVGPTSPLANPPALQQYSSRTPGEGYPFPRVQRQRTNYQQNTVTATPTAVIHIEAPPERLPARSSPPVIDMDVFQQLLAMEDDDVNEQTNCPFSFTKSLVEVYFEDGQGTVEQMECSLSRADYKKVSQLAHFLRGSAASLGVCQVAATCEALELEISSCSSQDSNSLKEKVQAIKLGQLGAKQWFDKFYRQ
ncbi:hypothetical protein CROQUDRAFT_47067 [Cronartium quercuum f. sp. fusiforme G11]|uniref:HPt domain-containing protein n=1 Tax=Cronartium quercuum f. sp. fusiforme G11 TaxID=708437 RepID=A0A9P6T9Y6_9BASI|nr:hypothetical protein CROQUDRAFT_47067 [Cronartium quercuum f. sp. fusiforme G11]